MRVYTIGETVLDVIFKNNNPVSAKPGGSVLNSSVSLGRLGVDVSFISDYGSDEVGQLIDGFLLDNRVNTDLVVKFEQHKSALALAFLDEKNDASYSFYKDFPVKRLSGLNVNFSPSDYLLFGSFFAITDSIRESLLNILKSAKNAGVTIIYDPNFRRPHLHELDKVKPWIIENISFADVVKASDEDFNLIFQTDNPDDAYRKVVKSGCDYMIYTTGPEDVFLRTPQAEVQEAVKAVKTVSTIGAGDNFNAGVVWSLYNLDLHRDDLKNLDPGTWGIILKNGISFAAEVCMQYDNYISLDFAKAILKSN